MILFGWMIVALGAAVAIASYGKVHRAARRPANGEEKTLLSLEMKSREMSRIASMVRKYAVVHTPLVPVSK